MNTLHENYREAAALRFASMHPEHEGRWVLYHGPTDEVVFIADPCSDEAVDPHGCFERGYMDCHDAACGAFDREELLVSFGTNKDSPAVEGGTILIYKLGGTPPQGRGRAYGYQDGEICVTRGVFKEGRWRKERTEPTAKETVRMDRATRIGRMYVIDYTRGVDGAGDGGYGSEDDGCGKVHS